MYIKLKNLRFVNTEVYVGGLWQGTAEWCGMEYDMSESASLMNKKQARSHMLRRAKNYFACYQRETHA